MLEKVSIIMPVRNGELYLAEALESIQAQTFKNFDLIVVNDGSSDKSLDILKHFAERDSRIKILNQENRGISEARNRGLWHANTEWVFMMDADDVMLPNRIERQMDFIQHNPRVRVASCLARYIDEKGQVFGTTHNSVPTTEVFSHYLKSGEPIGLLNPGTVMHRETILSIGGYRRQFIQAGDIDLWNRLSEKGYLILTQDEVLMKYRIHSGSITTANFMGSQMHFEWACACMRARRNNEIEPDWKSFQEDWNNAPVWIRFNRWRKIHSKAFYRQSGRSMMNGKIIRGLYDFSLATLLDPIYTLPRVIHQVFGPKLRSLLFGEVYV